MVRAGKSRFLDFAGNDKVILGMTSLLGNGILIRRYVRRRTHFPRGFPRMEGISKIRIVRYNRQLRSEDYRMAHLTGQEALQLAADFALKAEYMRADDAADFKSKVELYETASRVAFLKACVIAREEEVRPVLGENLRRAMFVVA